MAKTKPGKSAAGKGPKAKKKADKPRKATAAELSDMDRQRLLLQHKRMLKPLLAAEKIAKDNVTKRYELAKKEGITKKELELAFLLDTDEGAEKVKKQMQRILDVDRWMGTALGQQLDMFPKASASEKAFEDGKRSSLNDEPARPPANLGQTAAQRWMEGWNEGRKTLNAARAEGFRPLGEVARAAMPEPIGDQKATHEEHEDEADEEHRNAA